MRRVEANAEWSLFCPNEAPGLAECWGEAFDALYQRFEREGRAKRTIKAQQLWFAILEAQVGITNKRKVHSACCVQTIYLLLLYSLLCCSLVAAVQLHITDFVQIVTCLQHAESSISAGGTCYNVSLHRCSLPKACTILFLARLCVASLGAVLQTLLSLHRAICITVHGVDALQNLTCAVISYL